MSGFMLTEGLDLRAILGEPGRDVEFEGQSVYRASITTSDTRLGVSTHVAFDERPVHSLTPKGFYILTWACDTQWFPKKSRTWFGSRGEALRNLLARRRSYVRHAKRRLRHAESSLTYLLRETGLSDA